jgi:7,8-dihydro-6-hydroxymethylpterin-pyrophosphokinase
MTIFNQSNNGKIQTAVAILHNVKELSRLVENSLYSAQAYAANNQKSFINSSGR